MLRWKKMITSFKYPRSGCSTINIFPFSIWYNLSFMELLNSVILNWIHSSQNRAPCVWYTQQHVLRPSLGSSSSLLALFCSYWNIFSLLSANSYRNEYGTLRICRLHRRDQRNHFVRSMEDRSNRQTQNRSTYREILKNKIQKKIRGEANRSIHVFVRPSVRPFTPHSSASCNNNADQGTGTGNKQLHRTYAGNYDESAHS